MSTKTIHKHLVKGIANEQRGGWSQHPNTMGVSLSDALDPSNIQKTRGKRFLNRYAKALKGKWNSKTVRYSLWIELEKTNPVRQGLPDYGNRQTSKLKH